MSCQRYKSTLWCVVSPSCCWCCLCSSDPVKLQYLLLHHMNVTWQQSVVMTTAISSRSNGTGQQEAAPNGSSTGPQTSSDSSLAMVVACSRWLGAVKDAEHCSDAYSTTVVGQDRESSSFHSAHTPLSRLFRCICLSTAVGESGWLVGPLRTAI